MEPGPDTDPARQDRLALIELFERDGRVARSVSVRRWPLTLGRALDNDLVVDDPFVAAQHATLQLDAQGQLVLSVGQSINGVRVGDRQHGAGEQIPLPAEGVAMQIGSVKLRLRLPAETLAPERPLPATSRTQLMPPALAGALLLLLALASHWISIDPGADAATWLPVAVGLPLALAAWSGLWALASKLFQHRFDFMGHLRIVLPWLLGVEVVDAVVPVLAASLSWPWLWRLVNPVQALLGLFMLRAHLTQVLPLGSRTVTAVLAVMAVAGSAISLTLTQRATDRYSRPAYMSTLPLSALHLAQPVPTQSLVQDLAPLAERLATRARKARDDEPGDGEPSNE